eukprot:jgi/Galph1/4009/GphlegSOOS_G2690.1
MDTVPCQTWFREDIHQVDMGFQQTPCVIHTRKFYSFSTTVEPWNPCFQQMRALRKRTLQNPRSFQKNDGRRDTIIKQKNGSMIVKATLNGHKETGFNWDDETPLPPAVWKPTRHDLETGRDPNRVKIFDTTLRDGEQSPGATLTAEEKLVIARQLAKLGVDVIEAGFPVASNGDFEAVRNIARTVGTKNNPPIICGLARSVETDISRCWEAVKDAAFPRIHTFIATSDIHLEHKLKKTRSQVLELVTKMVRYAKSFCEDVEFSAEDAIRSDPEFLFEVFSIAIEAGATTINVPDTVGYTTPAEFGALIRGIRRNVKGIENVCLSVHGHDDLGMAVANFLAAIENGAQQVECTINGIGERAGNAALEELVMALHVRRQYYNKKLGRIDLDTPITCIDTQEIWKTSKLVSNLTGMIVQPNKAIVGANAFAHESGIHQDGILKNRLTYEIMDAKLIGMQENHLVLGKHSGRHAFKKRMEELGFELTEDELNRAFIRFKDLADKKKEVTLWDLESIVNDEVRLQGTEYLKLDRVQVQCGDKLVSTATVTVTNVERNEELTVVSIGTGPVDAAFKALNSVRGVPKVILEEYSVNSVTRGIDALGEVTVRIRGEDDTRSFIGSAANTDIVVASAQAYINALNRCARYAKFPKSIHPQKDAV